MKSLYTILLLRLLLTKKLSEFECELISNTMMNLLVMKGDAR
jgi:hypothetical protein